MITNFSHSGTFGDVLYAFNFLYDYCEEFGIDKINFHIQQNVPTRAKLRGHPGNGVQLNRTMVDCIVPLLENIPIVDNLTTSNSVPRGYFNLDVFRDMGFSIGGFDIKAYYYGVLPVPVKRNLGRKILNAEPDERTKNKVVVVRSQRYNIPMNYKVLESIKDRVVLLGTDLERQMFYTQSFWCKYIPVRNFQEAANLMAGANFVVGNQTGLFAIAEQLKVPRVLESWQKGPNVVCDGGICYEGINKDHFDKAVEAMIERFYG